jgi:uncharacterized NAD(P)/FAD-binding protein YdhS
MAEADKKHTKVTIVGGGVSGIMAATKLTHEFLQKHPDGKDYSLEITLVDPQEHLGGNTYNRYDVNVPMAQPLGELGFDYADSFRKHMNRTVTDRGMNRSPEFWKKTAPQVPYDETLDTSGRPKGFDPLAFVTHNQYGNYVRTHLQSLRHWLEKDELPVTINTSLDSDGRQIEYIKADAVDAWEENGKGKVQLADGRILESDVIILATGNVEPRSLKDSSGNTLKGKPGYYNLDDSGLTKANVNETDTVAFIGMANGAHFAVMSAIENGYKGNFILCSADGTTPELRSLEPKIPYTRKKLTIEACQEIKDQKGTLGAEDFWALFKEEIIEARKQGINRHTVVDSIVKDFNPMWRMMNDTEKATFRSKHGREWGHMRYRMPEIHNQTISKLHREGRITYMEGLTKENGNDGIRVDENGGFILSFKDRHGDIEEIHVPKIVNNTGPSSRLADMSPLMRKLEEKGVISQHPLGGMRVDDNLHAIGSEGHSQNVFYAVGPIISGEFFEGITIPAIRQCTEYLAKSIVNDHILANAKDFKPSFTRFHNEEDQIGYAKRESEKRTSGSPSLPSY